MADLAHALPTRNMEINIGPSHPAMHGTVRIRVELELQHDYKPWSYLNLRLTDAESDLLLARPAGRAHRAAGSRPGGWARRR